MQYVDVILLFVSKTSTFDSLNSQYLEIFGFIISDSCVSQMWYSYKFIQHSAKKSGFSSLRIIHKEKLLRQTQRQKTNEEKKLSFHCLFTVSFDPIDPCDVTRTSVDVFVTAVFSFSVICSLGYTVARGFVLWMYGVIFLALTEGSAAVFVGGPLHDYSIKYKNFKHLNIRHRIF